MKLESEEGVVVVRRRSGVCVPGGRLKYWGEMLCSVAKCVMYAGM
jgi:hypothetical protein